MYGLKHRSHNLPPGPWSLPFIGNFLGLVYKLFRTGDEPEYQLAAMAKRYGDVFTLRVGSKIVIIANSYKSIKEAYQNPLISDRPKSKVLEDVSMDEGKVVYFKHQTPSPITLSPLIRSLLIIIHFSVIIIIEAHCLSTDTSGIFCSNKLNSNAQRFSTIGLKLIEIWLFNSTSSFLVK